MIGLANLIGVGRAPIPPGILRGSSQTPSLPPSQHLLPAQDQSARERQLESDNQYLSAIYKMLKDEPFTQKEEEVVAQCKQEVLTLIADRSNVTKDGVISVSKDKVIECLVDKVIEDHSGARNEHLSGIHKLLQNESTEYPGVKQKIETELNNGSMNAAPPSDASSSSNDGTSPPSNVFDVQFTMKRGDIYMLGGVSAIAGIVGGYVIGRACSRPIPDRSDRSHTTPPAIPAQSHASTQTDGGGGDVRPTIIGRPQEVAAASSGQPSSHPPMPQVVAQL